MGLDAFILLQVTHLRHHRVAIDNLKKLLYNLFISNKILRAATLRSQSRKRGSIATAEYFLEGCIVFVAKLRLHF